MAASVTDPYKNAPVVLEARKKVLALKGKKFSDIISKNNAEPSPDDSGIEELQWVDLVTAGGGMLGIGLLGYTYILEMAGIRFVGLGGTSAGAINTMLIAARRKSPDQPCSLQLLETLASADFPSFLDGPELNDDQANAEAKTMTMEGVAMIRGKSATQKNSGGSLSWWASIFSKVAPIFTKAASVLKSPLGSFLTRNLPTLQRAWAKRGLHKGQAFEKWMRHSIHPVETVAELTKALSFPDTLELEARRGAEGLKYGKPPTCSTLKVVAADITTQTRAVFPDDAPAYWKDGEVNPAAFVRASMSIPFFFLPFEVDNVPNNGTQASADKNWHIYNGTIPKKVTFVDGGMLSNFPMDLYNRPDEVPLYPTFGVMLGNDPDQAQDTSNPGAILGAMFNSSRHILDRTYLGDHKEKSDVIGKIDTKDFFWLDFNMSETNRVNLFAAGAKCAADFLEQFDWDKYKTIRTKVQEARKFLIW